MNTHITQADPGGCVLFLNLRCRRCRAFGSIVSRAANGRIDVRDIDLIAHVSTGASPTGPRNNKGAAASGGRTPGHREPLVLQPGRKGWKLRRGAGAAWALLWALGPQATWHTVRQACQAGIPLRSLLPWRQLRSMRL